MRHPWGAFGGLWLWGGSCGSAQILRAVTVSGTRVCHSGGSSLARAQLCGDQHCGFSLTPPSSVLGHCQGDGYRVGFGLCAGKVLPALSPS